MAYGRICQACFPQRAEDEAEQTAMTNAAAEEWLIAQEQTAHVWSISPFPARFITAPKTKTENVIPTLPQTGTSN